MQLVILPGINIFLDGFPYWPSLIYGGLAVGFGGFFCCAKSIQVSAFQWCHCHQKPRYTRTSSSEVGHE